MTNNKLKLSGGNLESVVIRFVGDSGDGMQLTGTQFSDTSAMLGNDIATFPELSIRNTCPTGFSLWCFRIPGAYRALRHSHTR
jgi:2-oxoglutarate ferredoxin oxidoreductase subunit alpha